MRKELSVTITKTDRVKTANPEALLLACAANDRGKKRKRDVETKLLRLIAQYSENKHQDKAAQKQLVVQLTKYKAVDRAAICKNMVSSQFDRYLKKLFKKTYAEVSGFLTGLKEHLEPKIQSGKELTERSEILELEFDEETQRMLWAEASGELKRAERSARSRPNYAAQLGESASASSSSGEESEEEYSPFGS
jgi:hypothetical protein